MARRSRPPVIAAAVLVAVATAGTAVPALADAPAPAAAPTVSAVSDAVQLARQGTLVPLADGLAARGAADPDFATTTVDPATNSVVVYRRGGGRTAVYDTPAVAAARAAGIQVVFRAARLTQTQDSTLRNLIWSGRRLLAAAGVTVTTVGGDGTGPVVVGVDRLTPAAQKLATAFPAYGAGAVTVRQQARPTLLGRQDDRTPLHGGSRITSAAGTLPGVGVGYVACTTSFGGRSAVNGSRYILTAYHCVNPADRRFFTSAGYIGTVTALDSAHDIAAIRVGGTTPNVFDGPWNEAAYTKRVTTTAGPRVGMRICTSGSFSGVRCYGTVQGYETGAVDSGWGQSYDATLWYASTADSSEIVRSGDSGGPVFAPAGATVHAVGVISAGSSPGVTCAGAPGGSPSTCYRTVYFADVATEAAAWHIDLTR